MQIITTATIKGGAGKTTTCAALAQAARKDGLNVLAIDLDPQANLTFFLGADQNRPGSYDLIKGRPAAEIMQKTPQGIYTISASGDLATLKGSPGSGKRLEKALTPLKNKFDVAFIDTPPTIGELTINALQASTALIIPMETDSSNIQGLYQILEIANQTKATNPALSIKGVIITRYDSKPNLNRQLKDIIADKANKAGAPLLMVIRSAIAIKEAQVNQVSLYDYAPESNPAKDYFSLYQLIL